MAKPRKSLFEKPLHNLPGLGKTTAEALKRELNIETPRDLVIRYTEDEKSLKDVRGLGEKRLQKALDALAKSVEARTPGELLAYVQKNVDAPAKRGRKKSTRKKTAKKASKKAAPKKAAPKKAAKKASKKAAPKKAAKKAAKKATPKKAASKKAAPKKASKKAAPKKASKSQSAASLVAANKDLAQQLMRLQKENKALLAKATPRAPSNALKTARARIKELESQVASGGASTSGYRLLIDCNVSNAASVSLADLLAPLVRKALEKSKAKTLQRLAEAPARFYGDLAHDAAASIADGTIIVADSGQSEYRLAIDVLGAFAAEIVR